MLFLFMYATDSLHLSTASVIFTLYFVGLYVGSWPFITTKLSTSIINW